MDADILRKLGLALVLSIPAAALAGDLRLLTEYSPPDIMRDGERIYGISPDLLRLAMAKTGLPYSMEIMAWRRAYVLALQKPDTCVFSTGRTPDREDLFKWVGPLREVDWTFFGMADAPFKLTALEDARPLRIGTYHGDVRHSYLEARGFIVDSTQEDLANPKKLLAGRIDLWATGMQNARREIARNGWTGKIVPLLTFNSSQLYLACNKGVPDATTSAINAALAELQRDGSAAAIQRKYQDVGGKSR
ncbi:substrate-binding periplasmic protein [Pseudoduganella violaceinigra]|uniref:substrate-binding periplasmic protein n=1 Tax=Pseudoduganella violaceinigra TaxID=246602 RepID=UPI000410B74F|nr:ABC transporter substrate-binding protein [Pseudoduganella violaceinigra]